MQSRENTANESASGAVPFDPTAEASAEVMTPFVNAMVGKAPSNFFKVRIEMTPDELRKVIGYDPRGLQPLKRGAKLVDASKHVSQDLADLVKEVQRSIDDDKVSEMVAYLHAAVSNGAYADWAELDVVTTSNIDTSRFKEAHEIRIPTSAEYFIIDGQHRYCALIDFVRLYPGLAKNFTQAVAISVMTPERIKEWAGQGFHDKNYLRTAVKATKALAVDTRDIHNVLAKKLHRHPTIIDGGGVNLEKDSLAAGAKEMVTHAILYKFVRGFCEGRRGLDKGRVPNLNLTEHTFDEHERRIFSYLENLQRVLPTWTNAEKRADYLFRSSPAWQAFGVIGFLLGEVDDEDERSTILSKLGEAKLNWRRANLAWESVIGSKQSDDNGHEWISPRASRQAIDGTINFLKQQLGLAGDDVADQLS